MAAFCGQNSVLGACSCKSVRLLKSIEKTHFFLAFKGSEGSGMAQVGSEMGYIGPKLAQVGQHDG